MQPPAGPSSTREAVDHRRTIKGEHESSSRRGSLLPSGSTANVPSSDERGRARSRTPPSRPGRSGSAESSISRTSGNRRTDKERESETDREKEREHQARRLADRESSLTNRARGTDSTNRDSVSSRERVGPRDRDRGERDRDRDRDRDHRRFSSDRDSGSRRARSPEKEKVDSTSRPRRRSRERDTPPQSRARSPAAADPRDAKRPKLEDKARIIVQPPCVSCS